MTNVSIKKKNPNYWAINRAAAQDSRLSLRAKGVMFYLLSKTDGWNGQVYDITKNSNSSKYAVKEALKELRQFGYVTIQSKVGEDGSFVGSHYIITDELPST